MSAVAEEFGRTIHTKPQAAIFSEAPIGITDTNIEDNIEYACKAFRILKTGNARRYDLESVIVTYSRTWVADMRITQNLSAQEILARITPHAHPQTLKDVNEFLGFDRDYVLPAPVTMENTYQTVPALRYSA